LAVSYKLFNDTEQGVKSYAFYQNYFVHLSILF